jgi:hypothetical protein
MALRMAPIMAKDRILTLDFRDRFLLLSGSLMEPVSTEPVFYVSSLLLSPVDRGCVGDNLREVPLRSLACHEEQQSEKTFRHEKSR